MNCYMILACSDYYQQVFDIYIDTVEAWSAPQAIQKFFKDNFAFKEMGTINGSVLVTKFARFKAVPTLIDTSAKADAQYLIYHF